MNKPASLTQTVREKKNYNPVQQLTSKDELDLTKGLIHLWRSRGLLWSLLGVQSSMPVV